VNASKRDAIAVDRMGGGPTPDRLTSSCR